MLVKLTFPLPFMRLTKPTAVQPSLPAEKTSQLPEIGRLAIGITDRTNPAKPFPRATDYFVPRGEFAALFTEIHGEKPTWLDIFFHSDDHDFSCSERLEIRDASGKLFAYGDGETFYFYNEKERSYSARRLVSNIPTLLADTLAHLQRGLASDKAKHIKWRTMLYVRFLLKDFPALGYWQFTTQATTTSIPAIRDTFDNFLRTFGTVRYVPFRLSVKKVKSNQPGRSDQYAIVKLTPLISFEDGHRLAGSIAQNPDEHLPISLISGMPKLLMGDGAAEADSMS